MFIKKVDSKNLIVKLLWLICILSILALTFAAVMAVPSGTTNITIINSSRYTLASAQSIAALAGNVTEMNLNGNSITNTWQGFFGNVSGKIVLGNSNNNTFYDWNAASPHGEVFATRTSTTPTWASIKCANLTHIQTEDTYLGSNETTDVDAVNNTFFNTTNFNQFYVGSVNINTSQNCFATRMYNASGVKSTSSFAEILLYDTNNMIYTSILEQPTFGFDNRTHQFEMLVGENGHAGDTATTPYYFYVELG